MWRFSNMYSFQGWMGPIYYTRKRDEKYLERMIYSWKWERFTNCSSQFEDWDHLDESAWDKRTTQLRYKIIMRIGWMFFILISLWSKMRTWWSSGVSGSWESIHSDVYSNFVVVMDHKLVMVASKDFSAILFFSMILKRTTLHTWSFFKYCAIFP